jgi:hypothetical protein
MGRDIVNGIDERVQIRQQIIGITSRLKRIANEPRSAECKIEIDQDISILVKFDGELQFAIIAWRNLEPEIMRNLK